MTIDEAIQKMREEAKRQRYNASFDKGGIYHQLCLCALQNAKEYDQIAEMLEHFKEYQQLEEQGRLIKLPCKVGTNVYYILGIPNKTPCAIESCVFELSDIYKIGKSLFLTKPEVEAKMKELRGNNGKSEK